jgi:hypothetical protein
MHAGIAVYSRRAVPLAAWTAGLELANVVADPDRACLVLESGVNVRWRYGNYRRTPENTADARAWEAAKAGARCGAASLGSSSNPHGSPITCAHPLLVCAWEAAKAGARCAGASLGSSRRPHGSPALVFLHLQAGQNAVPAFPCRKKNSMHRRLLTAGGTYSTVAGDALAEAAIGLDESTDEDMARCWWC